MINDNLMSALTNTIDKTVNQKLVSIAISKINYDFEITKSLKVDEEIKIKDGITAPDTLTGYGQIYIDEDDGDLKIKFGDGTVKVIRFDSWDNPKIVKKASSEVVNNSTTMQNDDDLVYTLPANGTFEIETKLVVSGAANADVKIDWSVTGDVSQVTTRACLGPAISSADNTDTNVRSTNHNLTTDVNYGCDGSTGGYITEKFIVETSSSGGNIQMRWAQRVAQASDTTMSSNSYMKITMLENY